MRSDHDPQMNHVLATGARAISFRPIWIVVFSILVAIGAVSFLVGVNGQEADRTWHAYLVNYLFWFSLGFGLVLFGPTMNMTIADWARPTKRLSEAVAPFLLLSLPMLWVLYPGRELIFSWIREPAPEKTYWLNIGSMFLRNSLGLIVLSSLAFALVYYSVKEDRKAGFSEEDLKKGKIEEGIERRRGLSAWRTQVRLSPVLAIVYGLVLSSVGLDLAMSLDPDWYSTLFPAYYFVNSFHMGLGALAILSALSLSGLGLKPLVMPHYFHDLGKILFGFTMVSGWFFYSQFIVIWYGNIPEETRYLIARFRYSPWEGLSYVVLIITFLFPIFILLFRRIKMSPPLLSVVAGLILVGYWIERVIIVAPTYWKGEGVPIGIPEVGIAAGFLGLIGLSVVLFLRKVPLLPLSDPLFLKYLKREQDHDLEEERKKFGFI
ncbi:MAG: hypothetical protein ACXWM6_10250 [Thermodesulfobacteriota bacterium]